MKIRIETLTTVLLFVVILLAGCDSPTKQKIPEKIEKPANKPQQEQQPKENLVSDQEVSEKKQTQTPSVSFEGLPTAFPESVTPENKDVWDTILKTCIKHPEYLGSLLPQNAKDALELYDKSTYEYNDLSIAYHKLYAQAIFERFPSGTFPDDVNLLRVVAGAWAPGPKTPREDVLVFIKMHEHIKQLCDDYNVPLTSQIRANRSVTNAYVYVGEYRKAAQNERELWAIVEHAQITGEYHEGLFRCFSTKPIFWLEEKAEEQEQKQSQ